MSNYFQKVFYYKAFHIKLLHNILFFFQNIVIEDINKLQPLEKLIKHDLNMLQLFLIKQNQIFLFPYYEKFYFFVLNHNELFFLQITKTNKASKI